MLGLQGRDGGKGGAREKRGGKGKSNSSSSSAQKKLQSSEPWAFSQSRSLTFSLLLTRSGSLSL